MNLKKVCTGGGGWVSQWLKVQYALDISRNIQFLNLTLLGKFKLKIPKNGNCYISWNTHFLTTFSNEKCCVYNYLFFFIISMYSNLHANCTMCCKNIGEKMDPLRRQNARGMKYVCKVLYWKEKNQLECKLNRMLNDKSCPPPTTLCTMQLHTSTDLTFLKVTSTDKHSLKATSTDKHSLKTTSTDNIP